MSETALERHNGEPPAPVQQVGGVDVLTLGRILARSGYWKDAREEAQAVVRVLYGQELGVGPITAMMGIHIIQGRPTASANIIAAVIRRSKVYDYRVHRRDKECCEIAIWRRTSEGCREEGRATWTWQDAVDAGLSGGDNWKHYPRAMLFARAISEAARAYCPDLFGGSPVYVPEELGAEVNPETGEVLEQLPDLPAPPPFLPPPAPDPEDDSETARNRAGARLFATAKRKGWKTEDAVANRLMASEALGKEVPLMRELTAAERRRVADWLEAQPAREQTEAEAWRAAHGAAAETDPVPERMAQAIDEKRCAQQMGLG